MIELLSSFVVLASSANEQAIKNIELENINKFLNENFSSKEVDEIKEKFVLAGDLFYEMNYNEINNLFKKNIFNSEKEKKEVINKYIFSDLYNSFFEDVKERILDIRFNEISYRSLGEEEKETISNWRDKLYSEISSLESNKGIYVSAGIGITASFLSCIVGALFAPLTAGASLALAAAGVGARIGAGTAIGSGISFQEKIKKIKDFIEILDEIRIRGIKSDQEETKILRKKLMETREEINKFFNKDFLKIYYKTHSSNFSHLDKINFINEYEVDEYELDMFNNSLDGDY